MKRALPPMALWNSTFNDKISEHPLDDMEIFSAYVAEIRPLDPDAADKTDEEIIEDFISEHQGEVMKIQAAAYCLGSAALHCPLDILETNLPRIDKTVRTERP